MSARPESGYRYVCDIARGGLGRVSLAYREEGNFLRLYAIKRLLPAYEEDPEARTMFADEGRVAGLLRHPNVVSVLDVGEDGEGMYLVMDYVEGVPLSRLIKRLNERGVRLPIQHCIRITRQIAEGLHAAHELRGNDGTPLSLVHRDVSPHNILIEPNGVVRVTDFGIAKALGRKSRTSTGLLKGNAGYIAPECLQFEEPDRRADLFSLGVVLYELVTGERLYPGSDVARIARRILKEPPPDLALYRQDVPDQLVALGFELVAKERDLRPSSAKDVIKRLDAILFDLLSEEEPEDLEDFLRAHLDDERVLERRRLVEELRNNPDTQITPARKRASKVQLWAAGLVLLAVGVVAGVSVATVGREPVPSTRPAHAAAPAVAVVSEPPPRVEPPVPAPVQPVQVAPAPAPTEPAAAERRSPRRHARGVRRANKQASETQRDQPAERWGWGDVPAPGARTP